MCIRDRITVFFNEGATQEQIDAIGEQIRQRPEVENIVFKLSLIHILQR